MNEIEKEITTIFNKHGLDTITNIPDYILADYVMTSLYALIKTKDNIDKWYGKRITIDGVEEIKGDKNENKDI